MPASKTDACAWRPECREVQDWTKRLHAVSGMQDCNEGVHAVSVLCQTPEKETLNGQLLVNCASAPDCERQSSLLSLRNPSQLLDLVGPGARLLCTLPACKVNGMSGPLLFFLVGEG